MHGRTYIGQSSQQPTWNPRASSSQPPTLMGCGRESKPPLPPFYKNDPGEEDEEAYSKDEDEEAAYDEDEDEDEGEQAHDDEDAEEEPYNEDEEEEDGEEFDDIDVDEAEPAASRPQWNDKNVWAFLNSSQRPTEVPSTTELSSLGEIILNAINGQRVGGNAVNVNFGPGFGSQAAQASPFRTTVPPQQPPNPTESLEQVLAKELSRWFYEAGLPFEAMDDSLQKAFSALSPVIPGFAFTLPSLEALRGSSLDQAYGDSLEKMSKAIQQTMNSRSPRPVSLAIDVWKKNVNSQQHVVNFMIANAGHDKEFFLKSVNTENTTGEALFELVTNVIDELENRFSNERKKLKISSLVVDNASNMKECGAMLEAKYPVFWSIPCQTQAMNLLLASWCKLSFIERYVELAGGIVTLILDHHRLRELYWDINKAWGCEKALVEPSNIRFSSKYTVLRRLLEVRGTLLLLFDHPAYKKWLSERSSEQQEQAKTYEDAVCGRTKFWQKVESIKDLLRPVYLAIRYFNRSSCFAMGYVWEVWEIVKSATEGAKGFSGRQRDVLLDVVKAGEREFKSCELFGAAHVLNPRTRDRAEVDREARRQLMKVGAKLYPVGTTEFMNFDTQVRQYEYEQHLGCFAKGEYVDMQFLPAGIVDWNLHSIWTGCSKLVPVEICTVACTVLGMPTSNSAAEGNLKAMKNSKAFKRNRLTEEGLKKLDHIYRNGQILVKKNGDENAARLLFRSFTTENDTGGYSDEEEDDRGSEKYERLGNHAFLRHECWDGSDFEDFDSNNDKLRADTVSQTYLTGRTGAGNNNGSNDSGL